MDAAPAVSNTAAQLCDALSHNEFTDWFLPSKDELHQIYLNLRQYAVGGFSDGYYWSSSDSDSDYAWYEYFNNGYQFGDEGGSKAAGMSVRAVRAF